MWLEDESLLNHTFYRSGGIPSLTPEISGGRAARES
jgi:hypothetical protein